MDKIKEAKRRWGETAAYKEFEQKWEDKTKEDVAAATDGLNKIFAEFGSLKTLPENDRTVQEKVAELKNYITEHFYTCTDEILKGLGAMYIADPRFKENIDTVGGTGTAEFVSRAIEVFVK